MLNAIASTESMSKEEWLEWRKKGIGGSDVSVICGINKYKSALELWMEKTGQVEATEAGEAAYWGNLMEPLVRDEFSKRTGLNVKTEKFIFQNPYHPFMFANLDGIVYDPTTKCRYIFEAKTANIFASEDWDMDIPEAYQLQVQHYMAVTGYLGAYIAVLIGGNKFKYYFLERDDDLINLIIKMEHQFWNCVINNKPPKIDGSKASTCLLNKLYPKGESKDICILPNEALEFINRFEEFSEKAEEATLAKEEAMNKLKEMLGNNQYGAIDNRVISWTNVKSERFDSKALKVADPDTYNKYINSSSYRRFSIK